jgi:Protein of unknown function (DUF3108)
VRTIVTMLLTTMAMSSGAAAGAQAPVPRPFVAAYEVTYRGLNAGALTFELSQDAANGRYVFQTRADPSALARLVVSGGANERSIIEIDADGVRPLEWRLDDGKSGDKGDGVLQFDWAQGAATGRIEREQVHIPTEPMLQDRLSIQIAVSTALLRGEEPGEIPLIDDNRVKRYAYTRKESTVLDSKLGPIDAVIYESTRPGSSRVSRLWLAPRLDYAPVRAEQIRKGKLETVMELTKWEATGGREVTGD